jgi:uncharacterized protein (TIGR03086 family)
MDPVALHDRGAAAFRDLVHGVAPGQWSGPTPDHAWNVRALVRHVVEEHRWVPPLVAGRRVDEVDPGAGDLPDEDPVAAHDAAASAAQTAVEEPGALGRTVHLSFGDVDGRFYVLQRTADLVVHGWDLAVATGQPLAVDLELVQAAWDVTAPAITPQVRAAGIFGAEVAVRDDAGLLDRLLGLTGRDPAWRPPPPGPEQR